MRINQAFEQQRHKGREVNQEKSLKHIRLNQQLSKTAFEPQRRKEREENQNIGTENVLPKR